MEISRTRYLSLYFSEPDITIKKYLSFLADLSHFTKENIVFDPSRQNTIKLSSKNQLTKKFANESLETVAQCFLHKYNIYNCLK
jgi:type II secretory pathway component GspD/PulD (secretin)